MAGSGELLGEDHPSTFTTQPKPEMREAQLSDEMFLDANNGGAHFLVPTTPMKSEHVHSNLSPEELRAAALVAAARTEAVGARLAAKFSAAGFEGLAQGVQTRAAARANSLRAGF